MYKYIILIIFILNFTNADEIKDAKNSGSSAGQSAILKYGSKNKINDNMSIPLQSTGQMTTIDGKNSFSAKIESCAENNNGLKIAFQPLSSGQLNIQINQDISASGSYNNSFGITNIDNICSGGYKIATGKYYKYNFDKSNKKLSVIEVTKTDLGGCFCITNSCNYGGFTQNIADKIVGDIIGTIGSSGVANYQVGINKYDIPSKTYYLYVKNDTSCKDSSLGNEYTNTNPTNYYSSQNTSALDLSTVVMKDENNSESLYYISKNQNNTTINTLNSGANHNISIADTKVCTVQKVPYLDSNDNKIKIETKDSCSEHNSCTLDREEICDNSGKNCINRVLNRTKTSLNIPIQCQAFNELYQVCANGNNISSVLNSSGFSSVISNEVGSSYFYSKRYYDCGKQTISYDASKSNNTFDTVNKQGSTLNYQDFNGTSQSINLGEFENCQVRYCRVQINTKHTQVYSDGTSNTSTKDGVSTIDYEFKSCNKVASGSYTCPLESGEKLIENCSCNLSMNAAGMAIGYASAVEDAVKDFTCSTN
jgi:hypothetical protein